MAGAFDRRTFLGCAVAGGTAFGMAAVHANAIVAAEVDAKPPFEISLAEWSFHRMLYGGQLDNLDFPVLARNEYDIDCVEYVNVFFNGNASNSTYLTDLKKRCDDHGVRSGLIMCDGEGDVGDPDAARRAQTVENHRQWVNAAATLGCHSIRVNAVSAGSYDEQTKLAADGLQRLAEVAAKADLNVIVENHGGLSSNGKWLAGVIERVGMANCGTLPDFGNFEISPHEQYDRYQGVRELMPYAKGVSAKSQSFDAAGNETQTDYSKMLRIVIDAGYHGYVGIEWNGDHPDEKQGTQLTLNLLKRIQRELA